ncbi:MAG: hypothetical protein GY913_03005 [Proteobacteria bacterium]|nr:hypothetical protein [Pseudomonadota bacterium]
MHPARLTLTLAALALLTTACIETGLSPLADTAATEPTRSPISGDPDQVLDDTGMELDTGDEELEDDTGSDLDDDDDDLDEEDDD